MIEPLIGQVKLDRYHAAIKMIEVDGDEGYYTCRAKYGEDIANVLLIAHLRRSRGSEVSYPPEGGYERVEGETNVILLEMGLVSTQS